MRHAQALCGKAEQQITANQIFNNTRLTNSMLRRIANILIDNNATTRQDYCETIAFALNSTNSITYPCFCDIADLLEPIYDFRRIVSQSRDSVVRAGDLDGYEAICLALSDEL